MIWNTIPNEERLRLWKKLRDDIKNLATDDQSLSVAKFCCNIPFGSRTMDYYSPNSWPTPWEILFYGSFCKSSISLLMFYTLALLPNDKIIELLLIDDAGDIYLLPVINNQTILNYHLGEISKYSDIQDDFKILKKYSQEEIKNIK
jgi:hypothetical protein